MLRVLRLDDAEQGAGGAATQRAGSRARLLRARYGYSAAAGVLAISLTVIVLQPSLRHPDRGTGTAVREQGLLPDLSVSGVREAGEGGRARMDRLRAGALAQLRESEPLLGLLRAVPHASVPGAPAATGPSPPTHGRDDGLVQRAGADAAHALEPVAGRSQQARGSDDARALAEQARRDAERQLGQADLPVGPPAAAREEREREASSALPSRAAPEEPAAGPVAPSRRVPGNTAKASGEADRSAPVPAAAPRLGDESTLAGAGDRGRVPARARAHAERFLAALEAVESLTFQAPSGYWRNTYTPGDPAMRLLRTRLELWHRAAIVGDARLEQAVRAGRQPLDAPAGAALGLHLQADKAAVSGVARVRLQIGLQGALRTRARPAMNLSVLLDLRGATSPTAQQAHAIVAALLAARQPGDRFSLSAAGPDGGLLVEAVDFRHGPLQVMLARLFAGAAPADAQPLGLPEALHIAARAARGGDDPDAAFGTSLVFLITAGVDDAQLPALQTIAHRNALAGIALSVVDTSAGSVLGTGTAVLERLVAAGQGQRRTMAQADDAARVIDAQLHAAGRAVARAARLRIRLASGVRLIDVPGSEPLAESQAARVREAEQSIDQRLARNLGIRADRGEDEDGIQIVIPHFFAGDSHVILLDLLVDGPGAVADVTLRYKDLVQLKNGVVRAQLRLPSGDHGPGPLQRNVLKNRVAFELAQAARRASRLLENGDVRGAIHALQSTHDLLLGLREVVDGWSSDPELLADAHALAGYVRHLQAHLDPTHQRYLVESLRYMAFRKLTATNEDPQS